MPLETAGPAELVRATQKDVYYLTYVREMFNALCQRLTGEVFWLCFLVYYNTKLYSMKNSKLLSLFHIIF